MIKIYFLLLFQFFLSESYGQKGFSTIEFPTDSSIHLYILGEAHFNDNRQLQEAIIKELITSKRIAHVVVEWPIGADIIFNRYVLLNDSTELPNIENLAHPIVAKNTHLFLNTIRKYNNQVEDNDKVSISTIDYVNYSRLSYSLTSLSYSFPELNISKIPVTQSFLFGKKKRKYKRKEKLEIIDCLIREYKSNIDVFNTTLLEKSDLYYSSLKTMKIAYRKGEGFNKETVNARDFYMYTNLKPILDRGEKCLFLCGAVHATKKVNDNYNYGFSYTPVTALIEQDFPEKTFSIITQYYKREKLINFFGTFNLLKNSMETYFPERKKKYVIIDSEQLLEHPSAKERCDMIIIQNCRRLKK